MASPRISQRRVSTEGSLIRQTVEVLQAVCSYRVGLTLHFSKRGTDRRSAASAMTTIQICRHRVYNSSYLRERTLEATIWIDLVYVLVTQNKDEILPYFQELRMFIPRPRGNRKALLKFGKRKPEVCPTIIQSGPGPVNGNNAVSKRRVFSFRVLIAECPYSCALVIDGGE